MKIVSYNFANPLSEQEVLKWRMMWMISPNEASINDPDRHEIMQSFVPWPLENAMSNQQKLQWMQEGFGIDTAFIFATQTLDNLRVSLPPSSCYPLIIMRGFHDEGHGFRKWTCAFLRPTGSQVLVEAIFLQPEDAVFFRLRYEGS